MLYWRPILCAWLAASIWVSPVFGQDPDPTVMPPCALECMERAMQVTTCAPTDVECSCADPAIQEVMGGCMPLTCSPREGLVAMNLTTIQCGVPRTDEGYVVFGVSLAGGVLALLSIILRLIARPIFDGKRSELLDDWAIIICGIIMVPFTIFGCMLAHYGYGRDIWTISFDNIRNIFIFLYLHQITYVMILCITKMSIVFFYMRVFLGHVLRGFRYILWGTMAWVIGFGVSFTFVLILQCIPVNHLWDHWDLGPQGKCINVNAMGFANGGINLAIDVWLLVLPLPQLWKLKMPLRKKLGVSLMFIVGLFVTVVSIPRIMSVVEFSATTNPTSDFVYVSFWAVLECDVGVICACLPRIYVLLSRLYRKNYPKTTVPGTGYGTSYGSNTQGTIHNKSMPLSSDAGDDVTETEAGLASRGGGIAVSSSTSVKDSLVSETSSKHKLVVETQAIELGKMSSQGDKGGGSGGKY